MAKDFILKWNIDTGYAHREPHRELKIDEHSLEDLAYSYLYENEDIEDMIWQMAKEDFDQRICLYIPNLEVIVGLVQQKAAELKKTGE